MDDPCQFRNSYKNNEPEALTIILQCLPDYFTIQHVFDHHDDKKTKIYQPIPTYTGGRIIP